MEGATKHYDFSKDNRNQIDLENSKQYVDNKTDKLDECIKVIAKKEGYISCDVVKKLRLADGGNFLGALLEIDIKGKTAAGNKETAIFVKKIDSDYKTMEILSIPSVYKNELFIYKELGRIYHKFQDDAKVPANERYNTVKCYDESYEKAIIMENLARKEFNISTMRMQVINLKTAQECVKQLAKFHGLSFVLEQKQPSFFDSKIKSIKSSFIYGEAWTKFTNKFGKMGMKFLDEELKSKIENKIPKIVQKLQDYYTDESIKYCLCHGDYRPNNIMVKEKDGEYTIIPVDYQHISYGCPVLDFIYFIYASSNRQFRKKHMEDLKNLYYKSLEDFLRYFDICAESMLPRKIIENLYKEKLDFGLAVTLVLCPIWFVSENDEIPDIKQTDLSEIDLKIDDKYKDIIEGTVEEMIDLGYI